MLENIDFFLSNDWFNEYSFCRHDTEAELEVVRSAAVENGAFDAIVSSHYAEGGKGADKLAEALVKACSNQKSTFRFLYDLNKSIEEKVQTIAKEMYGAGEVELSQTVTEKIQLFNAQVSLFFSTSIQLMMEFRIFANPF